MTLSGWDKLWDILSDLKYFQVRWWCFKDIFEDLSPYGGCWKRYGRSYAVSYWYFVYILPVHVRCVKLKVFSRNQRVLRVLSVFLSLSNNWRSTEGITPYINDIISVFYIMFIFCLCMSRIVKLYVVSVIFDAVF